jgi:CRISP-associated protein Cas1
MPVIYVKEQGAMIHKRGGRILVEKDDKTLLEIPLRQTDSVAVFGNVQLTTQAMSELLERSIPVAFYTRHGRLKGHLTPEVSKNVGLRLAQYRTATDETASLGIARGIVRAKLLNSAALLDDYRANHPSELLAGKADSLRRAAGDTGEAATHSELMGREGAGAAAYFDALAEMNRSELPFEGREKHPPPDPINSLLSLGYTMVLNELRGLVEGAGLEPHLGFLHRADYGRPSLALDLLEPFRSIVVDRLTLALVNERVFTVEHFASRATGPYRGSVILLPDDFRRYLEHYEKALSTPRAAAPDGMRHALELEIEKLRATLVDGRGFEPFVEGKECSG